MSKYRSLSEAHTEVIRERVLWEETPIFARVVGRTLGPQSRFDPYARLDFADWDRPALVRYIREWGPDGDTFEGGRRNLRTLRKIAADVRDWRGQPTDHPDDSDLIIDMSGNRLYRRIIDLHQVRKSVT